MFIDVALIMLITHVRNIRKKNVCNKKISISQILSFKSSHYFESDKKGHF